MWLPCSLHKMTNKVFKKLSLTHTHKHILVSHILSEHTHHESSCNLLTVHLYLDIQLQSLYFVLS